MKPKTAVVTGGSRGIGRAIAEALFTAGYSVVVNYHKQQSAAEALVDRLNAKGLPQRCLAVQADVSKVAQTTALMETAQAAFGPVEVLVNNAGIAQQKLCTEVTEAEWRTMLGVHLDGTFFCCQAALRQMIPMHRGRIINISSMWGQVGGSCEVPYSAAKAGILGLTKALAKEVGPSGITVNAICPGVIQTEMNAALSQETLELLREETPLAVLGTPEDVAAAVAFLVGAGGSFLTGQVLGVNGGMVI